MGKKREGKKAKDTIKGEKEEPTMEADAISPPFVCMRRVLGK